MPDPNYKSQTLFARDVRIAVGCTVLSVLLTYFLTRRMRLPGIVLFGNEVIQTTSASATRYLDDTR